MPSEVTVLNKEKISAIQGLINGALESIVEAAEMLCDWIDEDEEIIDKLVAGGHFQRSFLRSLESVGRRQLRPELFFSECPGHKALRKLPYSEQSRFLTQPVKVLILNDGVVDELRVLPENLTVDQTKQVFGPNGVRDAAAQRSFIEGQRAAHAAPPKVQVLPYKVTGKKVIFTNPCTMGAPELLAILTELSKH